MVFFRYDGPYDTRTEGQKLRDNYWEQRQEEEAPDDFDPDYYNYDLNYTEVDGPLFSPLDFLSNLSTILLIIYIIDKLFVKKDYKVSNAEFVFLFYFALKSLFPVVSFITLAVQIPTTYKILKDWLPKNVNKRKELEAELKLLTQY